MLNDSYRYDAFISYSHKDKEWVRGWLLPRLEENGVRVFIDFRDLEPGKPVIREIERAVLESRHTLLVLTPDYATSRWTEFENIMVQTLDPAAQQQRLIPLVRRSYELPLRLRQLVYLDFTEGGDYAHELSRLLAALKIADSVRVGPDADLDVPRIFFVDDNEQIRNTVTEWLESEGYIVRACASYKEALSILQSEKPFDVAVLDLLLDEEEIDFAGVYLLEETILIRQVPTIIVTAYAFRQLTRTVINDLFVIAVVDKMPLERENFLSHVKQAVGMRNTLEEKVRGTDAEVWRRKSSELYSKLLHRELVGKTMVEAIRTTIGRHTKRILELYQLEEMGGPDLEIRNELNQLILRVDELQAQLLASEDDNYAAPLPDRTELDRQRHARQQLQEDFTEDELRGLCVELGVSYDSLAGEDMEGKAHELVLLFVGRDNLDTLSDRANSFKTRSFLADILTEHQTEISNKLDTIREDLHIGLRVIVRVMVSLDRHQQMQVQAVREAIRENRLSKREIRKAFGAIQEATEQLRQQKPPDFSLTDEDVKGIIEVVDAPKLGVANKLKIVVPIIPLLLSYEGEIDLASGLNLKEVWNRLVTRARGSY